MKFLRFVYILCLTISLILTLSCASKPSEEEPPADLTDAAADTGASTSTSGSGDLSEKDLTSPEGGRPAVQAPEVAQEGAPATPPGNPPATSDDTSPELSLDTPPTTEPVPAPAPPAPEVSAQEASPPAVPAPEVVAETPTQQTGPAAKVTALDFKANLNGGTVVIKTNRPVQFTTRKNEQTNQFVIELPNTKIPKNFRRPYDTKEFSGPIGSINAYETQGTGRVVVQLREVIEPGVSQNGNVITIASQAGGSVTTMASSHTAADSADGGASDSSTDIDQSSTSLKEDSALQKSSIDDFAFGSKNKYYGRPISLELKDADIRDVFAFISEESGLNIIVGDDVTGKVTLKLRKIPWDQALMVLLQSKQLGYVRQGKILRISSLTTLQKESDQARGVLDAQRLLEPLHVQVFPISYGIVADIDAQAKDFLSPRGKSRADKRTNNLVVTDIDENLVRIKALVKRLDTQTPQVLIESKIIEARESFQRMMGVNWGFNGNQTDTGLTNSQGQPVYLTPNGSTQGGGTGFLSAGFTLGQLDVFGDITASLSLLETEGLAKVLSAPRIVTLDRQEAQIDQQTQYPYFTSTAIATTPTTGVATVAAPQISFQTVTLSLKVKPQITVEGSVIMDLDVTRQYADAPVVVGTSSARPINTRHAKTQVLVENGDTLVIGGIYQSDITDSTTGVPWLMNLPLLGWLFKNNSIDREKIELVIFLTPRILNRDKAFDKTTEIGSFPGLGGATGEAPKSSSQNDSKPSEVPQNAPPPPVAAPETPGGAG